MNINIVPENYLIAFVKSKIFIFAFFKLSCLLEREVQMKKVLIISMIFSLCTLCITNQIIAQESKGKLILRSLAWQSEERVPKKVKSQIDYSGIIWGITDSSLIITKTGRKFIEANFQYFTRFKDELTLELKTGNYKITCIGYENNSISKDFNEQLSKNSFFNLDILSFDILPEKTTIIEILPMIIKDAKSNFSVKIKMYMPNFITKIIEDGNLKAEKIIDLRNENSIAWDDYQGPLKFK